MGRFVETIDVLPEFENHPVVRPDSFENAVAIKQTVIHHGDGGLVSLLELAVDVDEEILFAQNFIVC